MLIMPIINKKRILNVNVGIITILSEVPIIICFFSLATALNWNAPPKAIKAIGEAHCANHLIVVYMKFIPWYSKNTDTFSPVLSTNISLTYLLTARIVTDGAALM